MLMSDLVDWMIPDIPKDISTHIHKEKILMVDLFMKEERGRRVSSTDSQHDPGVRPRPLTHTQSNCYWRVCVCVYSSWHSTDWSHNTGFNHLYTAHRIAPPAVCSRSFILRTCGRWIGTSADALLWYTQEAPDPLRPWSGGTHSCIVTYISMMNKLPANQIHHTDHMI